MPIIVGPGDPSSILVLTCLWLNSVDDPADVMSFRISSFSPGKTVNGEVRQLANRIRLIRSAGTPRRESATIVRPTATQIAWLYAHVGEILTIRDPDGGKFAGTYLDLGHDRPVEGADLQIAFVEVTSTKEV